MDSVIREFYERLKEQEEKYNIKICVPECNIIDGRHLDCFWYGGYIGHIEYMGYRIVIGVYGDRRVKGVINGHDFFYKSKDVRYAYHDGDTDMIKDDEHLHSLCESTDCNNYLDFIENNWFEVNLINPEGKRVDLCGCDNVLDNNLFNCFDNVDSYFDYVHWDAENRIF